MKQVHSTKWKRSTQPRKQRKYVHNLPEHLKGSQLQVHLSKELRAKHGVRAVRVRTGDKVRVLRGTHKGKEGKVERVDVRECRIYVAKVEMAKLQGGASQYPLRPSNCLLVELTNEKRRFKRASDKTVEKKAAPEKAPAKAPAKNEATSAPKKA